jgi:hypothetical protein
LGPIGKGVLHAHRRQFLSGFVVEFGGFDSFHENGLFLQQVGGLLFVNLTTVKTGAPVKKASVQNATLQQSTLTEI